MSQKSRDKQRARDQKEAKARQAGTAAEFRQYRAKVLAAPLRAGLTIRFEGMEFVTK